MNLTNRTIIRSISGDQEEILQWIIDLYCPNGFEVDPTYSKGVFYKGSIPQPTLKSDINPQYDDVLPFECTNLPYDSSSINSIIFDPPFLASSPRGGKLEGKITSRFGYNECYYTRVEYLWEMYRKALVEFNRILSPKGVLVFKCQDVVDTHKQFLSHVKVINMADDIGLYAKDLFVLSSESVMIGHNQHKQQHARKFHSYFLVFVKEKSKVKYGG